MKIDLTKLKDAELDELITNAQAEKAERAESKKAAARQQILQLAQEAGVSLDELLSSVGRRAPKASRAPVPPKYRNTTDASLTWSGRGKRPAWVNAHLEAGGTLDQLAI